MTTPRAQYAATHHVPDGIVAIVLILLIALALTVAYRDTSRYESDRLRRYERAMSYARTPHDSLEVEVAFQRQIDSLEDSERDPDTTVAP